MPVAFFFSLLFNHSVKNILVNRNVLLFDALFPHWSTLPPLFFFWFLILRFLKKCIQIDYLWLKVNIQNWEEYCLQRWMWTWMDEVGREYKEMAPPQPPQGPHLTFGKTLTGDPLAACGFLQPTKSGLPVIMVSGQGQKTRRRARIRKAQAPMWSRSFWGWERGGGRYTFGWAVQSRNFFVLKKNWAQSVQKCDKCVPLGEEESAGDSS